MLRLGARAARRRLHPPDTSLGMLRAEVAGRRRVLALVPHGLQARNQRAQATRVGAVPRASRGILFTRGGPTGGEPRRYARHRTPPRHLRAAPTRARNINHTFTQLIGGLSPVARSLLRPCMLLPTGKRTFTSAHSTGMCAALTEQYVPDYIGRLENLAEDFPRVGEQIGVKLELPHM